MNKIFTSSILILLIISGCAKQNFYLFKPSIESNTYQHTAKKDSTVIQPETKAKIGASAADSLTQIASSSLELSDNISNAREAQAIAQYLSATNNTKLSSASTGKKKSVLKHNFKKKLLKLTLADEKPINKIGKAGFILSLVGLGLILTGLLFTPLFTVGFIISVASLILSAIGLSQIKKNPGAFSNKTQATIGLAISIGTVAITILFSLLFLLLLVIFFSSYN